MSTRATRTQFPDGSFSIGSSLFRLQSGSRRTVNPFGIDVLVRRWRCHMSDMPRYEPAKFTPDHLYSDLVVDTWTWTENIDNSPNAELEISFLGLITQGYTAEGHPIARPPTHTTGTRRDSVRIGDIEYQYKAQTTTWKYSRPATASTPDGPTQPEYRHIDRGRLYLYHPRSVGGAITSGNGSSGFISGFGGAWGEQTILNTFESVQRGLCYEVTEVWEKIADPNIA
jgi:hypothetical protein